MSRMLSCSVMPMLWAKHAPIECSTIDRCEYTTPFGLPVVPLVKHIDAAERSSTSGQSKPPDSAASSASYSRMSAPLPAASAPERSAYSASASACPITM